MTERFHPINGFPQDFDRFLKDFLEAKSLRFRVFVEVWKKHNFSFIMCGRQTQKRLDDFLNCLFYQLVDFTQSPHEIETQVCALYMLYGFYFKQPVKGRIRIRLTNPQWSHILQLEAAMRREGHWDLVYVYSALCSAKAFHFCATRQPFFPFAPLYPFMSDENLPQGYGKPLSTIIGIQRLQMLDEIHTRYQYFKRKLPSQQRSSDDVSELTSDLNLVRSNFFTSLREKIFQDEEKMKAADNEPKPSRTKSPFVKFEEPSSKNREENQIMFNPDTDNESEDGNVETCSDNEDAERESENPSSSCVDIDENWRTRGRRTSMLKARIKIRKHSGHKSDEDMVDLSIGERRKVLKSKQYGSSPLKGPAKRSRYK